MKFILLTLYYYGPNPIWALFGFILMIFIIVLAIREKLRKTKFSNESKVDEQVNSPYVEKDVLGLDKTYINYNEPTYKSADKSKLKFIMFIIIFFIGLLLMIAFTPIRYGAYKGTSGGAWDYIHHPDDRSGDYFFGRFYWDYYPQKSREWNRLDSALIFKPKNIFEKEEKAIGNETP